MVQSLVKEIKSRAEYLQGEPLESIYFGGGTPSVLSASELDLLFETIHQTFNISPQAEITLEANPDDLSVERVQYYRSTPVNRFSIGVQSFFDEELTWMNRAHNGNEAIDSIQRVLLAGFNAITIDLIYGSPTLTDDKWLSNLEIAHQLGLNHISAYCLTVEPKTQLDTLIRKKMVSMPSEQQAERQFQLLIDFLESKGFEQYEISNFARNHQYAVHNTNYWRHKNYLGIGPSAHSFNQTSRSWNIANNARYIQLISENNPTFETEILSTANRINETIMTQLRTIWGINMQQFSELFGNTYAQQLQNGLERLIGLNQIERKGTYHYRLKRDARILADGIAASLFVDP